MNCNLWRYVYGLDKIWATLRKEEARSKSILPRKCHIEISLCAYASFETKLDCLPLLYFQPKFLFRNTSRMITTINFTHVGDKEGCMHPLHMFQYEFSQTANADTKDSYLVLISWSKTCVKLLILYLLMCVYLQKLQVIPPPLFTSIYLL